MLLSLLTTRIPTAIVAASICLLSLSRSVGQEILVTIDTSPSGRGQVIDGFGTCISGTEGEQTWWQSLFFDDLQCSILRIDLTPRFKAPYAGMNGTYNSPWYHNNPSLPGPDNNNVRVYTNATDYGRLYNGWHAPIAVMGPDIDQNTNFFDFNADMARVGGKLAELGSAKGAPDQFKLIGSLWSPAPWLKISSGNLCPDLGGTPMPVPGTPWPFIWFDNFAGGRLDTSETPMAEFDDSTLGGSGPTSALTQFARCTAAYLRGFQNAYQVRFYAISIQNELNFEEFYNSCTYPLSTQYLAALKAVRSELDKYSDLAQIRIMGPEDLLGGDVWGMWQYGGGSSTIHKNLQYLQKIAADPLAAAAEAFFCIHGYASDGVNAPNATPTLWNWWANGWTTPPTAGIPPNIKGFTYFGKKSWMTETSGEDPAWLSPASGFPNNGAWSLASRIHQALVAGQQSAWVYWQLTDGSPVGKSTLTSSSQLASSSKYAAAKHFFRYIRPNAIRLNANISGSTNLLASAFLHETNGTLTLVLINTSSNSIVSQIAVPSNPAGITSWQQFTSSNGSYWQSTTANVTNQTTQVTVPGYGIVTLYAMGTPVLRISSIVGGFLSLSWVSSATGFQLQSTTNLNSTEFWSAVTTTNVASTNGWNSVDIAASTTAMFYRLAK